MFSWFFSTITDNSRVMQGTAWSWRGRVRYPLDKKRSFSLRNSSVNVTKTSSLQIWSHLQKKFLMGNVIFCTVFLNYQTNFTTFNYFLVWFLPFSVLDCCVNIVLFTLDLVLVPGLCIAAIKYIFHLIRFVSVLPFFSLLSLHKIP